MSALTFAVDSITKVPSPFIKPLKVPPIRADPLNRSSPSKKESSPSKAWFEFKSEKSFIF